MNHQGLIMTVDRSGKDSFEKMILNVGLSFMSDSTTTSFFPTQLCSQQNVMPQMPEGQGESFFITYIDWKGCRWLERGSRNEKNEGAKVRVWLWEQIHKNLGKDQFLQLQRNQILFPLLFLLPQAHLLIFLKMRDNDLIETLGHVSRGERGVSNRFRMD